MPRTGWRIPPGRTWWRKTGFAPRLPGTGWRPQPGTNKHQNFLMLWLTQKMGTRWAVGRNLSLNCVLCSTVNFWLLVSFTPHLVFSSIENGPWVPFYSRFLLLAKKKVPISQNNRLLPLSMGTTNLCPPLCTSSTAEQWHLPGPGNRFVLRGHIFGHSRGWHDPPNGSLKYRGRIFGRIHCMPWPPKRESKCQWFMSNYI